MTPAASFYQLLSSVSFTLLGLWFVVQGLGHNRWQADPNRHASARHIALHFFLPGTMGLAAVLAGGESLAWRVPFMVGAVLGLAESVAFLRSPHRPTGRPERLLSASGPLLYVLVGATTLVPAPVGGLAPLQLEGIATGLVFLVGLGFVWRAYAEAYGEPADHDVASPATSSATTELMTTRTSAAENRARSSPSTRPAS